MMSFEQRWVSSITNVLGSGALNSKLPPRAAMRSLGKISHIGNTSGASSPSRAKCGAARESG
jgi:hypothetical protein